MKHRLAKKLVPFSVIGTMVAMVFMSATVIYPHPLVLVLAMSIGQAIALFSLVLYLLAVALDLQTSGGSYLPYEEPLPAEEPPVGRAGDIPGTLGVPPEQGVEARLGGIHLAVGLGGEAFGGQVAPVQPLPPLKCSACWHS